MEECAPSPIKDTGLRNVVIASTKISNVVGDQGKLIYRGYSIGDLAEFAAFEEVIHLLLYERLPSNSELVDFKARLKQERGIPSTVVDAMKTCPKTSLPMDVLQAAVPLLANHDGDVESDDRAAAERMGVRLIAKLPTVLAVWHRIKEGKAILDPLDELDHAANFLYMFFGEKPSDEAVRFFDACLVMHAEHSFNASTFAAREIASTRAHIYAAVAGAIGSLSGALHGGANTRVMKMLKEIGDIENVEDYVTRQLDSGGKIMGLGHAVYDTDDPRALILAPMSRQMGEKIGDTRWYEISRALEEKAKAAFKERKGKDIFANVDFYSASLYHTMGFPMEMFTPIFAISRVTGWVAHVMEEQFGGAAQKPMLYRPESEYVGDYCGPEECSWEPIEKR
jgi:citrate synthase